MTDKQDVELLHASPKDIELQSKMVSPEHCEGKVNSIVPKSESPQTNDEGDESWENNTAEGNHEPKDSHPRITGQETLQVSATGPVSHLPQIFRARNRFPEQPIGPMLWAMRDVLQERGFEEHRRQALVCLIAMSSSGVGRPMTLLISSDPGADALIFMHSIGSVISENRKCLLSQLSPKLLHIKPNLLQQKTVLVDHIETIRKSSRLIESLLRLSMVNNHQVLSSKGAGNIGEVKILGPTSLVALTDLPIPGWLSSFQFLHEHLSLTPEALTWDSRLRQARYGNSNLDIKGIILAKELESLRPQSVIIPFENQIISALMASPDMAARLPLAWKVIETITIMNRAESPTNEAIFNDRYGLRPRYEHGNALVASKAEYYLFSLLFPDLFNSSGESILEQHGRVFDAILRINKEAAMGLGAFLVEKMTERVFINYLDREDKELDCWADILTIKEALHKGKGPSMSEAKIRETVKDLVKKGLISRKKAPGSPNKFVYAAATFSLEQGVSLPPANEIMDPIFNGQPVDMTNILTGESETI